jgi:hypothetical protein
MPGIVLLTNRFILQNRFFFVLLMIILIMVISEKLSAQSSRQVASFYKTHKNRKFKSQKKLIKLYAGKKNSVQKLPKPKVGYSQTEINQKMTTAKSNGQQETNKNQPQETEMKRAGEFNGDLRQLPEKKPIRQDIKRFFRHLHLDGYIFLDLEQRVK